MIVHAAAERRPDVCEKDLPGSEVLNVEVSWHLGRAAAAVGAAYIYISTDYLFGEDVCHCLDDHGEANVRL